MLQPAKPAGPKPIDPAYQRDMMQQQPYPKAQGDSDASKCRARIEYINARLMEYRASEHFQKYERKVKTIRRLINQELPPELRKSKFQIITGMMRGGRDNLRDFIENTFDAPEIFNFTPMVADPAKKQWIDDLNEYQINFANSIKYKNHVCRLSEWMIEQGWAVSHTYYKARNGWATKPQADPQAPGGIRWTQEQDRFLGKPVGDIVNPRNWAGSLDHHIDEQPFQIFIKRWSYSDVIRAQARKTVDGDPIYNPEALNKLKLDFEKKHTNSGAKCEFIQDGAGDMPGTSGDANKRGQDSAYVDVLYYSGPVSDIRGHEQDDNRYFIEVTGQLELRFAENQMDEDWAELVHFQSHSDKSSPFTMAPLDPMINFEKVNSFLMGLGIEGQVDSMTRYLQYYEDDFLNPEIISNPKNLVNILRAKDSNTKPPQWVEAPRSASLDDLQKIFTVLDRWGQRIGTTDQEQGVSQGPDRTLGETQILLQAATQKSQAFSRRFCTGLQQEFKQMVLLDLMHSDMAKKSTYARDGRAIKLGPEHVTAFVGNTMVQVTDWITRNRGLEMQKIMNAMTVTKDILMALGSPDPAVRMARNYLKASGLKDVDEMLPNPDKVDLTPPKPAAGPAPLPGAAAAAMSAPPPPEPIGAPADASAAPAEPMA
ncbi:MAG: hypothetical protein ABIY63_13400 [Fibrobacteria bacterium]